MRSINQATAGKTYPPGATAKDCLQEPPKPQTPPVVRTPRFGLQPEPEAIRVHRGKSRDPDVFSALVHGVSTKACLSSAGLLNPPRVSEFQERLQELRGTLYPSRQRAPVGRAPPPEVDLQTEVFGIRTCRGRGAGELLNPRKSRAELELEVLDKHQLYVRSHNHYFVGERISRNYDLLHFKANGVFGLPTPHFNDGRFMARTLRGPDLVQPSEDGGCEETEGQTPAAAAGNDTMELTSSEKTFGIVPPRDLYGAGEVIHCSSSGHFTRDPAPQQRGMANGIRHHLKNVNFRKFPTLLQAFSHYDKKGRGLIERSDLEDVCHELHLDTSLTVLQELLDHCDLDRDGRLSFLEFSNFLCWKHLMPITVQDQKILIGESASESGASYAGPLLRPEDLEPLESGSSLRVPRTLTRTRGDPEAFSCSSALIGADHVLTAVNDLPRGGVPSVRTDLPAPRLRRVSDRTNYGDVPTAAALLCPHVHAALGVHEEDFLSPRCRHEMAEIFRNIGVQIPSPMFDAAWDLAAMRSPAAEVSVESFRNALREIQVQTTDRINL